VFSPPSYTNVLIRQRPQHSSNIWLYIRRWIRSSGKIIMTLSDLSSQVRNAHQSSNREELFKKENKNISILSVWSGRFCKFPRQKLFHLCRRLEKKKKKKGYQKSITQKPKWNDDKYHLFWLIYYVYV
jgi:hypothetical protein